MFNLRPDEISQSKNKLNLLIEYARTVVDDPTDENIKWAIRSLGTKLGSPPLGEKLIPYLTRFAYLHLEGLKIAEEKGRFIKNSL